MRRFRHQSYEPRMDSSKLTLIITNIKGKITEDQLNSIFSKYGRVFSVYLCIPKLIFTENNFLKIIPMEEWFARIQFVDDERCQRAWEDAQDRILRINNDNMAATLVSEDESPIEILYDYHLQYVFLMISDTRTKLILEEVCELWKRIGEQSWKNITSLNHSLYNEVIDVDKLQEILMQCNDTLIELNVDLSKEPIYIVSCIEEYCMNLRNLVMKYDPWIKTKKIIKYLSTIFIKKKTLRRLCLESVDDNSDFRYLEHLGENILELHLFAKHMESYNVDSVMNLSGFRKLKVLHLCSFLFAEENSLGGLELLTELTHLCFIHTSLHHNAFFKLEFMNRLEHLEIPFQPIDDNILSTIIRNNPNLKYLNISDIPGPLDITFKSITRLNNLEKLIMRNLYYLNGNLLRQLLGIEYLDCEGCSLFGDEDFGDLISFSNKLRKINISNTNATPRLIIVAELMKFIGGKKEVLTIEVSDQKFIEAWNQVKKSEKVIVQLMEFTDDVQFEWNSWKTED